MLSYTVECGAVVIDFNSSVGPKDETGLKNAAAIAIENDTGNLPKSLVGKTWNIKNARGMTVGTVKP